VPFETAIEQWQAGVRRMEAAPAAQRATLERGARAIQDELRRRLGGSFTSEELASLYDAGTGWATDLAVALAPDDPWAWDTRVVTDAAFGRYVNAAVDYAGGRRL